MNIFENGKFYLEKGRFCEVTFMLYAFKTTS